MNIYLETENEQAATDLANEILDDVCGKKVDTWHHCLRAVHGNAEASCIYHYTEHTPGRQTKLHLVYKLVNMIMTRYPGKFSGIKFEW